MRKLRRNWAQSEEGTAEAAFLELLHREADNDLTPDERALLEERANDPDVQAARTALRRAVMFLSGPNPPAMPRSVASAAAREIALSADLTSPTLPHSVADQVTAEVVLSRALIPPAPPHSVANIVLSDLRAARLIAPPPLPSSVAARVVTELAGAKLLAETSAPRPRNSVAAALAQRIAQEGPSGKLLPKAPAQEPEPAALFAAPVALPECLVPAPMAPTFTASPKATNPAPLLLIVGLLVSLSLLVVTTAWPNLAAGATVLRTLLEQVSPLAEAGLALLLLTSALITWKPTPALRNAGAGAFALAAVLTIPALYNVAGGSNGLTIGQNVTVSGPVQGNVIAIGGNVNLRSRAKVHGEVVTLLGDVRRDRGAQVSGGINALLGHAPSGAGAIQTAPVSGLNLVTAAAFRPLLGWLGSAAWPQIFVALTGGLLLLLFVGGAAPQLARRQRHAPMRTLALGVLLFSALLLPALGLTLLGFFGPALLITALTALLIATGLSVSVYDLGRAFAYRLRLPVPDAVGALLGLSSFAASLSYAPLAFTLALIGGAWGAGTLFLSRQVWHPET